MTILSSQRNVGLLLTALLLSLPSLLYAQSLFPVRIGTKWGFIDREGVMRIQPVYDGVGSDGVFDGQFGQNNEPAIVMKNGKYSLVDTTGRLIIGWTGLRLRRSLSEVGTYDYTGRDSSFYYWHLVHGDFVPLVEEGSPETIYNLYGYGRQSGHLRLKIYVEESLLGFRNPDGSIRIPARYGLARPFTGRYAPVNTDARYDSAGLYMNGYRVGGKWGLIDVDGNVVLPEIYDDLVAADTLGEFWIAAQENAYGLIDRNGSVVLPFEYSGLQKGDDSAQVLILVDRMQNDHRRQSMLSGLIRRDGSISLPLQRESISHISGQFFTLDIQYNRHMIIDASGRKILEQPAVEVYSHDGNVFYTSFDSRNSGRSDRTKNARSGIIDRAGKITLDTSFTLITPLTGSYAHFAIPLPDSMLDLRRSLDVSHYSSAGLHGLIRIDGTVTIPPTFTDLEYLMDSDSLVTVMDSRGNRGVLSFSGRVVIPPGPYSKIDAVGNGILLASYGTGSHSAIISNDIDLQFSNVGDYSATPDGRFLRTFHTNDIFTPQHGFNAVDEIRDRNDHLLFSTSTLTFGARILNGAGGSDQVLVQFRHPHKWGVRDSVRFYSLSGAASAGTYRDANPFMNALASVQIEDRDGTTSWGFIHPDGSFAITPRFDSAGSFGEAWAPASVRIDGEPKWGFIDRNGRWKIQPQFDGARTFRNGLAAVMMLGDTGTVWIGACVGYFDTIRIPYWGFIDREGSVVIPPRFRYVTDFSDETATAYTTSARGLIDTRGDWRFDSTRFYWIGEFSEGHAAASHFSLNGDSRACGYIDQNGNWVIPPRFYDAQPFRDGRAVVVSPDLTATFRYVTLNGRILWDSRAANGELDGADREDWGEDLR